MIYINLINTDLKVSAICLGTMNYGSIYSEEFCFQQLDDFLDMGGNFIDTAHVYNDWVPGELSRSEKIIGRWLKRSNKRNHVILLTKGGHPPIYDKQKKRISYKEIRKDLEESLQYLNTDYIDIYFLHRDDPDVPVEDILSWLNKFVSEGKIRYFGCSNWLLHRIIEAQSAAEKNEFKGFICNQIMWSMACINVDKLDDPTLVTMNDDFMKYHNETGLSLMAYSSQAKGYFSRRYAGEKLPDSITALYNNTLNEKIYKYLCKLTTETGFTIGQLGLGFFLKQPFTAIPLVSCDTKEQLKECMGIFNYPNLLGLLPENFGNVTEVYNGQ